MPQPTVLILGAGASCSYGFPVGSGLRKSILELQNNPRAQELLSKGADTIRRFVREFAMAQSYSIDAFLGRRNEFAEIGKRAIACVLLACEQNAVVFSEAQEDHWYQYLLNALTVDDWDDFDPSWLSIVTFNYDRSLETFLRGSLQACYGKSQVEVDERLKKLEIVHVYGSLGKLEPWPQGVPFGTLGANEMPDAVEAAARNLVVIREGKDDGETLTQARSLIGAATRVCFLGFGFDQVNIQRLGAPATFRKAEGHPKRAAATSRGLYDAEVTRASVRVFGEPHEVFKDMNCISLLRHSLILD